MSRFASLALALALTAALAPNAVHAEERNPFADPVGPPPGRLLAAAHLASHHRDGYGLVVGAVPLPWLQLEVSAAYYYELSLAAVARVVPLPRAALTPFVGLGANRAVQKLSGGLRYTTVSAIATTGLQARVSGRWFVAAEIAVLYEVYDTAKAGSATATMVPADRIDVLPGAYFGAYFL